MEPFFPPELEQAIFERAAESAPECIPVLLLVCLRVYHWLEPMRFKTITASKIRSTLPGLALLCYDDDLPQDFPSRLAEALSPAAYHKPKSPDFLHKHVRNLSTDEINISALLLSLGTGVTNLYFNGSWRQLPVAPPILPLLFALKLQRLSMPLQILVDNLSCQGHPFFSTITHFQALDRGVPSAKATHWPSFLAAHFPALTHVSFTSETVSFSRAYEVQEGMQNLYTEVLRRCTTLQVLVHFVVIGLDTMELPMSAFPDVDDVRAVLMIGEGCLEADWVKDVRGSTDVWTRAETVIEKRCLGPSRIRNHPYSVC
ncbi:hypothetical protein R3P38DRAFT_3270712 [Favolaschia claudopus]|uniref:F-box domain-containing protein n=1 Tax=Favolaschia claudopus TaxID=2862362 RepID=A0AAW0BAN3_9AGAR